MSFVSADFVFMSVCAYQLTAWNPVGRGANVSQIAIHKILETAGTWDDMCSLWHWPKEDVGFLGHNDLFHGSILSWYIGILLPAAGWPEENKNKTINLFFQNLKCWSTAMSFNTVKSVWGTAIRIHMFLGLPDPEPSLFVRIWIRILQAKSKKNLDFYCFFTSFWLFVFEDLCKYTYKK